MSVNRGKCKAAEAVEALGDKGDTGGSTQNEKGVETERRRRMKTEARRDGNSKCSSLQNWRSINV